MVNACVSYARCHFQELATHSNWSWWIFILYAINASDEKGWNTIQKIQWNVCQTFNRRDQQHHRPTRSSVNIVRPGHLANITNAICAFVTILRHHFTKVTLPPTPLYIYRPNRLAFHSRFSIQTHELFRFCSMNK